MKVYLCFDDTDTKETERGTGRLARSFVKALPSDVAFAGVVRQQLPRLAEIQQPENVHFTPDGSKALAGEVARAILEAAGLAAGD